ncbi:hypothetical protein MUY27_09330 [Mucilaginibacter sp. RS28]|uniref:DUF1440 domain-containing protein n=1 Tax=Mucilaginibacter straminoryzae TaxID=2932774 RepID=A0A9X2B9M9_9SPHI|nr:hypothetical protein [Mucilaginibacter straminoryzae]MCJ8209910.1 hypothetical protein [Mucilaginibacter straminoryzae]
MAPRKFYPTLLLTFLLAGTMDALAAIIFSRSASPEMIFRFIASGVFGTAAFTGGKSMVALGVLFHYLIAYIYTATGFILYPNIRRVFRNKLLIAFLYGFCIWVIMNYVVLPLSNTPKSHKPLTLYSLAVGLGALVFCIGLPIAVMAGKYYRIGPKKTPALI